MSSPCIIHNSPFETHERTLATDRGFKERVSEDMLIRLLDAFVWRNHGEFCSRSIRYTKSYALQTDKRTTSSASRTCKV